MLAIDLNRLDQEWEEQPRLALQAGLALSAARAAHATAENEVDLIEAQVALEIRADPAAHGFEKLTEAIVKEAVTVDMNVRAAKKEVVRLRAVMDDCQAKSNALEHRKKALEDEVFLWSREYFSQPRARDDGARTKLSDEEKRAARRKGKQ